MAGMIKYLQSFRFKGLTVILGVFLAISVVLWTERSGIQYQADVKKNAYLDRNTVVTETQAVKNIEGVHITQPRQSNAVFAVLPAAAVHALHQQFHFYDWNESSGEVRWMTSFDTTAEQVDAFAAAIQAACQEAA